MQSEYLVKTKLVWAAPIAILLLATLPLPYHLYIVIRVLVFASALKIVYLETQTRKNAGFIYGFAALALLHNPLAPIHLTKGLWIALNLICAGAFYFHLRYFPTKTKEAPTGVFLDFTQIALKKYLKPIAKAPELRTVNGIGATFLGRHLIDPSNNIIITWYFGTVVFLPLVPLGLHVVQPSADGGYYILGRIEINDYLEIFGPGKLLRLLSSVIAESVLRIGVVASALLLVGLVLWGFRGFRGSFF